MTFPRPGACPVCGVFCAVRMPHDCQPPERLRSLVRYTGVSPYMAWPQADRVRRDGSMWLRSPLPEVGPRLLALLARHRSHARRDLPSGKRARYGPAHALRDLVEGGATAVLDEVERPAPAWVPCSGTWHRVLLWDGELCLLAHTDVDLEAERVAAALSGQPLHGCVEALHRWQFRDRAVRLPWLESLASLEAALSFGIDALATWDAWIDARVSAAAVRRAADRGIDAEELLRWVGWERDPDEIAAWREVGWTSREAGRLAFFRSLTPTRAIAWREAGFDVPMIEAATVLEISLDEAAAWWAAGFQPRWAGVLLDKGVGLDEARRLKQQLGRIDLVLRPYLY